MPFLTDDISECIFLNKSVWILINIPLKFIPKDPIDNIPALVWIILVPNRRQAIIWTNGGLVYWRIYVSLGFNKLGIAQSQSNAVMIAKF